MVTSFFQSDRVVLSGWIKQEENGKPVSSDFQMADFADLFQEKRKKEKK